MANIFEITRCDATPAYRLHQKIFQPFFILSLCNLDGQIKRRPIVNGNNNSPSSVNVFFMMIDFYAYLCRMQIKVIIGR
jgi:hypothetical protein